MKDKPICTITYTRWELFKLFLRGWVVLTFWVDYEHKRFQYAYESKKGTITIWTGEKK